MQNFYVIAIRENKNDLFSKKKSVGARIEKLVIDSALKEVIVGVSTKSIKVLMVQQLIPKESINIPKSIFEMVKPIFVSLSSDDLLKKMPTWSNLKSKRIV